MPVMLKVVVPTLVRVTVFAGLVVPTATEPKSKLVGESFAVVPIPLSVTFCGLPVALSVTDSVPVRFPICVGLKVTLTVQLAPAASELPQVWVCAKSPALVPVIAMEVIVNLVVPTLVRVTVFAGLVVPTATEPKFKLVGERLRCRPDST